MENGLDKCSSLPSSDMKIGSHSGLLSRLINILSAKAALVQEHEEPHTHVLAGSLRSVPKQPLCTEGTQASRRVVGSFQWPLRMFVCVRLTRT